MTEELRHLPATVHGRYLLRRPEESDPQALLVGFHGQGQRAEDQMEAMIRLAADRPWALVSVQALHPYYRRGSGKVGACWMTSLDRELAIDDNVEYVTRVLDDLRRVLGGVERTGLVGFSQGVAMAYRTAARSGHPCHALVALVGDVPPELRGLELPGRPPVLIGRGYREPWYSEARFAADVECLRKVGTAVESCSFDGGHEWTEAFVEAARAFLDRYLGL